MTLLTVTWKDLRLLARDRAALLFLLLVPIVVITVIAESLAGSGSGTLLLPVVNEDEGPVAEVLIETLGKHVEIALVSRAEAEDLVAGRKRTGAALVLPAQLSKRYLASRASTLTLLTDPAKAREVDAVRAFLLLADKEAAALADPFSEELLDVEESSLTGTRKSIPPFEQNIPGFSLMFVLMGVLFGVSFGLRDEIDCGAMTRLRAAPISLASLLGGKLLARFLVGLTQLLLLFGFGALCFDLSLGESPLALLALCVAIVFAMTGFGLFAASLARTREQIIPLGLTLVMIVCAIGGCWWPVQQMPHWLQQVAHASFTAWAMDGIHDLILRERGLRDVLPAMGVLLLHGSLGAFLGGRWIRLGD